MRSCINGIKDLTDDSTDIEERVFLLTVQSRRRVSAEIIRSDDPTVSRIIVFGFLSLVPFPQGSSYVETWLPWDWGTSGRD